MSTNRLESSEPPKMIYDSVKTKPVVASSNTRAASNGILPQKMLNIFENYQKDMEFPVYKVRGTPDKIAFGISTGLIVIGIGMSLSFIYRRAFPPAQ